MQILKDKLNMINMNAFSVDKTWLLMRKEEWIYFSKAFSTASCSIPVVKFRKYEIENYKMGKKPKRFKYQA